jgi:hypothetical protein
MGDFDSRTNRKSEAEAGRILHKSLFLYLLDLEVKRARRYQNFLSLLMLRLMPGETEKGDDLPAFFQVLSGILADETRDSDLIGHLEPNRLALLLPYADNGVAQVVRSRLEGLLGCYDFEQKGFQVRIDQASFPVHGTNPEELLAGLMDFPSMGPYNA